MEKQFVDLFDQKKYGFNFFAAIGLFLGNRWWNDLRQPYCIRVLFLEETLSESRCVAGHL